MCRVRLCSGTVMTERVDALVEPSLLLWARTSIGFDILAAAKKIGISPERLMEWEAGQSKPTIKQLITIANVYKRPLAVFYLPAPPNELDEPFDALRDWRRLPDTQPGDYSTGLRLELRKAEARRDLLLELYNELDEPVNEFELVAEIRQSPDVVARRLRAILGVTPQEQTSWRNQWTALRRWTNAIERQDVLIFQTGFYQQQAVDVDEMRGVAIWHSELPIIISNGQDTPNARIFTLLHEFGHLLLRVSSVSNDYFDVRNLGVDASQIEIFCNQFAAELLVPTEMLLADVTVAEHGQNPEWDEYELSQIARKFSISREVILRRLLTLGLTTENFYDQMRQIFLQQYVEARRKLKESSGGPPYHTRFVRHHGAKYVSTVFDAYDRGAINTSDVSQFLGVKIAHIADIRADLDAVNR